MNPLPVHNHETTFVTLARELFQLTPFEWQRRVGKKLTAAASHENFSRTLNGYVFCTNQLILYDLLAILPC